MMHYFLAVVRNLAGLADGLHTSTCSECVVPSVIPTRSLLVRSPEITGSFSHWTLHRRRSNHTTRIPSLNVIRRRAVSVLSGKA
jgi:hypothetical protein